MTEQLLCCLFLLYRKFCLLLSAELCDTPSIARVCRRQRLSFVLCRFVSSSPCTSQPPTEDVLSVEVHLAANSVDDGLRQNGPLGTTLEVVVFIRFRACAKWNIDVG